ncbi:PREDICTED: ATP-dependent DNA helicase PIF1-like [Erythranthe guttata]|uniref:ATP-dependent DNA helicase PIF1-like n=1 Tax=Erythranthe guttata TaxID=4155 RepID=UPI00064DD4F8|nr:PREDICTED: ATP-dependent DNA helicase PIF1-like [Erythranthe guttata]|eukprot:XP_012852617.1 PREDICTED: ATP-dependent DNA helicase PIF1-like [Erythranthe guttata]
MYFSSFKTFIIKVLSGKNTGDVVFIPRMTLVPSNSTLPIKFQRRQFPLMISFAMTINKSQGQTLSHVGLYLPRPVFSHGQLYVALSRVKSRSGIKILIKSESGGLSSSTSNVVYKEVFQRI